MEKPPGPALGLFDGAAYETHCCKLSLHDVVLLFTDGLFEVEGLGGRLYDYQQLSKAVGNRAELPAVDLCRGIIDEVQQFSATQEFNDDVCLVAMDINRLETLIAPLLVEALYGEKTFGTQIKSQGKAADALTYPLNELLSLACLENAVAHRTEV